MGVGCLAQTDMAYNKHMSARILHKNGFAYGFVEGNEWQVFQAKKGEDGKWIVPTKLIKLG